MDDSQHQIAIDAFAHAIRIAGSQTAIAKICECTPGAISQLVLRGRPLSTRFVLKVEAATGISRHDLRPDIYPREAPAAPPAPLSSHPEGNPFPEGRTTARKEAETDPLSATCPTGGGEAARSSSCDQLDRAANTPAAPPPIGKAAA